MLIIPISSTSSTLTFWAGLLFTLINEQLLFQCSLADWAGRIIVIYANAWLDDVSVKNLEKKVTQSLFSLFFILTLISEEIVLLKTNSCYFIKTGVNSSERLYNYWYWKIRKTPFLVICHLLLLIYLSWTNTVHIHCSSEFSMVLVSIYFSILPKKTRNKHIQFFAWF